MTTIHNVSQYVDIDTLDALLTHMAYTTLDHAYVLPRAGLGLLPQARYILHLLLMREVRLFYIISIIGRSLNHFIATSDNRYYANL